MDISTTAIMLLMLPLCTGIYYFVNPRYRNAVLIVFSLLFYGLFEPVYIWLTLFGVFMNYLFGKMISYSRDGMSKAGFVLGIIVNIALLAVPKYLGGLLESLSSLTGWGISVPQFVLPMGMSFFVLRAISYLADCRKGRIIAERSIPDFMLYMTMFPLSACGPVVRYETIEYQLSMRHTESSDICRGYCRLVTGMSKKLLLADRLWIIAHEFMANGSGEGTVLGSWYGIILYVLCLYFDFSAYSDIAIGSAGIFGFSIPENFKHPFESRTVGGFFERWNLSLTFFFKDYVKGRSGAMGTLLMWLLLGLWHGASWSFVLFGVYFGIIIMIEELMGRDRLQRINPVISHILSKVLILIGFAFFSFRGIAQSWEQIKSMLFMGGLKLADSVLWESVKSNLLLMAAAVICVFPLEKKLREYVSHVADKRTLIAVRASMTALILLLLIACCSVLDSGFYQIFLLKLF